MTLYNLLIEWAKEKGYDWGISSISRQNEVNGISIFVDKMYIVKLLIHDTKVEVMHWDGANARPAYEINMADPEFFSKIEKAMPERSKFLKVPCPEYQRLPHTS